MNKQEVNISKWKILEDNDKSIKYGRQQEILEEGLRGNIIFRKQSL